jgi:hypothetical protein
MYPQNVISPRSGERITHPSDGAPTPGKRRCGARAPQTTQTEGNDPSAIHSRGTDTRGINNSPQPSVS